MAFIDGIYINLYDENDNVMLHVDDECYFLSFNVDDIHIPLICHGLVIEDQFLDGLNKQYIIQLIEIVESPNVIDKYFYNKLFRLCTKTKSDGYSFGKPVMIHRNTSVEFMKENFFRVDAVFVRKNYSLVRELKSDFMKIIKDDLTRQLIEVDEMINS